jgi:hypothetical protein
MVYTANAAVVRHGRFKIDEVGERVASARG